MPRAMPSLRGADEATSLLTQRVRLGLWIILVCQLLFALADLQLGRRQLAVLWAIKAVVIAGIWLAFRQLCKVSDRRRTERVALAAISLTAVGSALSGLIVRDLVTTSIVAILIALAAATLLPWGTWRQVTVGAIVGAAVIAGAFGRPDALPSAAGYPGLALGIGLVISVIVSREMARFRETIAAEKRERERTAEALASSEARYRDLFENANDIIFTHDMEGRFTSVNRAAEEITGYGRDEILRMKFTDVLLADDAADALTRLARFREQGPSGRAPDIPSVAERRVRCKDGRVIVLEVSSRVVFRDGQPVGIEGVAREITERKAAETAVRESVARLRQVASQLPGIVYQLRVAPDGALSFPLVVDSPYLRQFGVTPEQVQADPSVAFHRIFSEDRDNVLAAIGAMSVTDRPAAVEFRGLTASGETKWFRGGATVQRLDDGSLLSTGLIIDITERKLAEEAAVALAAIVQSSDDAIIGISLDGTVLSWNAGAERIYGYSAEEMRGKPVTVLLPADRPNEVKEILERLHRGERVDHFETVRVRKDGRHIHVSLTVSPVKDSTGRLIGTSSIARDISERIAMEAELRRARDELEVRVAERTRELLQSNLLLRQEVAERQRAEEDLRRARRSAWETSNRLNAVLQTVSEGIVSTDSDGTIVMANREAEKIWGYSQGELAGKNIEVLMPENYRPRHRDGLMRHVETGLVRTLGQRQELEGLRKDGTVFPLEICVAETRVGERRLFTAAVRDISKRKQTEMALQAARDAAEEASRAKSAFLANVSHEIRTPMNAVIGMTNLLLDSELSREQVEMVETIRSAGATMLALINDLLDSSKVEAGRMELETQPFDLVSCVEDALELVAAKAAEKGLDLGYWFAPGVPQVVVGDVARVRQVLVNLLSNAVRFTHSGEVEVSASARPVGQAQEADDIKRSVREPGVGGADWEICFSVRDTGIGIPEDRFERIFQSFSQVDSSTTRRYGGTGLGLSICRRLAALMGGTIRVESEVGKGSTFRFTLTAPACAGTSGAAVRGVQPWLAGRRVLIVESHAVHSRTLRYLVESWGMEAQVTSSSVTGLDWIRRGDSFDVVILDVGMDDPAAAALLAELRTPSDSRGTAIDKPVQISSLARPTSSCVPVVLLTSLGKHLDTSGGQMPGCEPVSLPTLTRPVRAKELLAVLARLFGAPANDVPVQPERRALAARSAARLPLRILVAEDNEVNQQVALRLLARLGYRADVAADGVEVIQALRRQRYDVVLMDVQMPVMDGLEATRRIVEQWAPPERPRIIAMTAHALREDRERCLAAGMHGYISKPVEIDELVAELERCSPPARETETPMAQPPAKAGGQAGPPPAREAIDVGILHKLEAGAGEDESDIVVDLIDIFLRHGPETLDRLGTALNQRDYASLNHWAHRLKSGSAQLGATTLSALCAELEQRSRDCVPCGARDMLSDIEQEFARVRVALEAERRRRLAAHKEAGRAGAVSRA